MNAAAEKLQAIKDVRRLNALLHRQERNKEIEECIDITYGIENYLSDE